MIKQVFALSMLMLCAVAVSQAQTKETRNVGTFTKISFRVPGKLYLRQGSPQKVVIEGKQSILKEIDTDVEGGRLVIGKEDKWDWNWGNDEGVTVYITVKDIEGVSVGGSGDIIGETKITGRDISLSVSGSGNMKIEVEASGDLEGDVSGSGNMELIGKCRDFNSDVSGSGKVILSLHATGKANFGISGSGKVEATGSSESVKASISGSGKVLAANLATNKCEVRISGSGDVEINVKNELDANISGSGNVRYKGNPSKINSHAAGSGNVRKL